MLKKLLLPLCFVSLCATAAQAQLFSKYDFYVAGRGGASFLGGASTDVGGSTAKFKDGYFGGVALGLMNKGTGNQGFRLEVEGTWSYNKLREDTVGDIANMQGYRLMGNLYYDIPLTQSVFAYLGGGAGGAQFNWNFNSSMGSGSDQNIVFAYQGMAGIGISLLESLSLEIGYRITGSQDPKYTISGTSFKVKSPLMHNAEVSLRFNF